MIGALHIREKCVFSFMEGASHGWSAEAEDSMADAPWPPRRFASGHLAELYNHWQSKIVVWPGYLTAR